MTVGLLISYYHSGPVSLALLRLLIGSLRQHLPRDRYHSLVIVDDCSPEAPEWQAYLAWLTEHMGATVYRLGPPRLPYYHQGPDGKLKKGLPPETSYGHAIGIMAGFHKLRELGCTHAWVLDGDCVLLDDCDLDRAMAMFQREKVAVVTDYYAGRQHPDGLDLLTDEACERGYRGDDDVFYARERWEAPVEWGQWLLGFPVLFCGIVDLTVEERFGGMANQGWVNVRWGRRLFRRGYRVGYHPFFQGRHVFHLGYGFTRHNAQTLDREYGNLQETARYGGKTQGLYHAGYLQLAKSGAEFEAWLLAEAERVPFDGLLTLDRSWLVDPPEIPMHGRPETYVRPFLETDFDALREIDADPVCDRFLSWGPHGEEMTRRFLNMACFDRRRWFALVHHGEFVGYGELRPLESSDGLRTAGLSYVVQRSKWGQGLGKFLVSQLYEIGFGPMDYEILVARIDVENHASLGALKASSPDWEDQGEEVYQIKGEQRLRRIYVRRFTDGSIKMDRVDDRERLLFDTLGVWR